VFITAPGGYFEVAEACSGVKFLIAMVAYGTLVANVCFRSWPRRAAFMAMALVVPILANGVRAWGTVFIAGRSVSASLPASTMCSTAGCSSPS
jgi:exosortase